MKLLKSTFTILFFCTLIINISAQSTILKVWPDGVPGSIQNERYTEKSTSIVGLVSLIEKVTDPSLSVFLPPSEKATGVAVLICPGGGYGVLAINHEGTAIAQWLNENGIAGIILKYRLPSDLIMKDKSVGPLQDAQEAMRIIRRNAADWKIDLHKIGIIGFSAGGHLASTLATHFDEKVYSPRDTISARPDFTLLIYPVISFDASITHAGSRKNLIGDDPSDETIRHFSNELQITDKTPPAFLVHSANDKTVPVMNSILYFEGLQKYNIASELHVFQKGGHGYGLAINKGTQSAWPDLCLKWMKTIGLE
jgi:acetyl esterase/lipase